MPAQTCLKMKTTTKVLVHSRQRALAPLTPTKRTKISKNPTQTTIRTPGAPAETNLAVKMKLKTSTWKTSFRAPTIQPQLDTLNHHPYQHLPPQDPTGASPVKVLTWPHGLPCRHPTKPLFQQKLRPAAHQSPQPPRRQRLEVIRR
jgi:hypothetical protein